MPTIRVGVLKTLPNVSREIARVYKQARRGEIETQDASRFVYMLNVLSGVLRDQRVLDEFSRRIEAVEG
jgi:hypothetical protein